MVWFVGVNHFFWFARLKFKHMIDFCKAEMMTYAIKHYVLMC